MTELMKINILGAEYSVIECDPEEDPKLNNSDGYADTSVRKLVVDSMNAHRNDPESKCDLDQYKRQVLRHEIVHAFLYESGLDAGCGWALNETIIDWIAIQIPKMAQLMKEGGLL